MDRAIILIVRRLVWVLLESVICVGRPAVCKSKQTQKLVNDTSPSCYTYGQFICRARGLMGVRKSGAVCMSRVHIDLLTQFRRPTLLQGSSSSAQALKLQSHISERIKSSTKFVMMITISQLLVNEFALQHIVHTCIHVHTTFKIAALCCVRDHQN